MRKTYDLGHEKAISAKDPFAKIKSRGRSLSPSKKGRSGKRKSARLVKNRQV